MTPQFPRTSKAFELAIGDLVFWTGKSTDFTMMKPRVIYQVIERKEPEQHASYAQYRFRPVFDIANPVGITVESVGFMTATREMKKLNLLDLGILRLTFDNFIRDWTRSQGADVDHMPTSSDVFDKNES